MGTASQVRPTETAVAGQTEPPAASERSRIASERRIPTARESMATLPELEVEAIDFEAHDTIPAPPWLEDEIVAPRETPSSP
jgi:hypothetical protein